MQAIKKLGGSVLCNNSFSGSYVSYLGHYAAMLPGRIRNLATEEDSPDMILIYTGINDVANDIPLDAFQRDYTDMLQKIHRFHPGAEIWAGTLCMGQAPSSGRPYYIEPEHFQNIDAYNTVIRTLSLIHIEMCIRDSPCSLTSHPSYAKNGGKVPTYNPAFFRTYYPQTSKRRVIP